MWFPLQWRDGVVEILIVAAATATFDGGRQRARSVFLRGAMLLPPQFRRIRPLGLIIRTVDKSWWCTLIVDLLMSKFPDMLVQ